MNASGALAVVKKESSMSDKTESAQRLITRLRIDGTSEIAFQLLYIYPPPRVRPRPPLPPSWACCLRLARGCGVGDGGRVRGSNHISARRFPPMPSRITTRWQSSRKRTMTFGLMGPARFCDQDRVR
jgi:hypothetical protein